MAVNKEPKSPKQVKTEIVNVRPKNVSGPMKSAAKKKMMKNRTSKPKGVVKLRNLPHGFHERQMFQFFSQFGRVERLKLCRNRKTMKSKSIAFIEFANEEVAQIVADTMNNYLMFDCLVKSQYIPREKVRQRIFDNWWKFTISSMKKNRYLLNRDVSDEEVNIFKAKALREIRKVENKLAEKDINYKCFVMNAEEIFDRDAMYIDPTDTGIFFKTPPATKKIIKRVDPSLEKETTETPSNRVRRALVMNLPKFFLLGSANKRLRP